MILGLVTFKQTPTMKRRTLLLLLLGITSLTSCKQINKARELSDKAVVDFHLQLNEGKFKEIYAAAHADLKSATTEEDFVKLLDAVHRKLGRQVKSTSQGWRLNTVNGRTTMTVTHESEFEHGKGTEIFAFAISGESCTLREYQINSQDMMIK